MKTKKRQQSSSDESEESEISLKSESSSDSESDDSSASEHRHRKRRKHVETSDSNSESNHKKSKKRKHKKKKKKHGKKKRRSESGEESESAEEWSVSDGEISPKKKRKHKHKHKYSKRARSSSGSESAEEQVEKRLQSVVKERKGSSEGSQPSRTYYQKEYRHSPHEEEYNREREVERFYRGSSKERKDYQDNYHHERERHDRYPSDNQDGYDKYRDKIYESHEEYVPRQRYFDHARTQRYEVPRQQEEYQRKIREDNYQSREDPRPKGFNRYQQYEERPPNRREFDNGRDFRERRGPPEPERNREREYPDKRNRYRQEEYPERSRPLDDRRERPQGRPDKRPPSPPRERSDSRVKEERYGRERRQDNREEREDRPREDRGRFREMSIERRERPRGPERRGERRPNFNEQRPRERKSRFETEDNKEYSWGKTEVKKEGAAEDKEKPNFGLSGKLTADANTVNGVVIKYTEPDDAKQPKRRWRFYPFKGDKALPILYIHRQSCFLIGRDKKVVDISLEHPSISKQHAALQYRATPFKRADGSTGRRVRPYVIDLDSANGTFVNNKKIEARRYVELLERDVVKFGFSQREYVLLHENSKDDAQDDDNDPIAVTTTDQIKREKRVKQEVNEDGEV